MTSKKVTIGGLEVPYSIGDEFYTILEPDMQARYDDHFTFKAVGPDVVESIHIDANGISVGRDEGVYVPIIEIFKTKGDAQEFIDSLGIKALPFKERDKIITPKGEDTIMGLSIDYDRRKIIVHTVRGYNFTMEEWGDTVTACK